MTDYAQKLFGQWSVITGAFLTGEGDDALQHPFQWLAASTDDERAERGVYTIADLPDAPSGVKITGTAVVDVMGLPAYQYVTEPYSLADAKALRIELAKVCKAARIAGGCTTPFGTVQTDDYSRGIISGASLEAFMAKMLAQQYSIRFTLSDNSVAQLTADQMLTLGTAVANYVQACQDAYTAVRSAINNAATCAAVFAVDVAGGYPA